jgi:hypothetical protein
MDERADEKMRLGIACAAAFVTIERVEQRLMPKAKHLAENLRLRRPVENRAGKTAKMMKASRREGLAEKVRTRLQKPGPRVPAASHQRAVYEKMRDCLRSIPRHGLTITLPLILRSSIMRIASLVFSSGNTWSMCGVIFPSAAHFMRRAIWAW